MQRVCPGNSAIRGATADPNWRTRFIVAHCFALKQRDLPAVGAGKRLHAEQAQLGATQPAVYRHFDFKGALLLEVAMRSWMAMQVQLTAAVHGASDPFDAARTGPLPPLPREHYFHGLGGAVPIDEPLLPDVFRSAWALSHGLATFVVERAFQLVDTDEARLAAADGAIDAFIEMMRARWPVS